MSSLLDGLQQLVTQQTGYTPSAYGSPTSVTGWGNQNLNFQLTDDQRNTLNGGGGVDLGGGYRITPSYNYTNDEGGTSSTLQGYELFNPANNGQGGFYYLGGFNPDGTFSAQRNNVQNDSIGSFASDVVKDGAPAFALAALPFAPMALGMTAPGSAAGAMSGMDLAADGGANALSGFASGGAAAGGGDLLSTYGPQLGGASSTGGLGSITSSAGGGLFGSGVTGGQALSGASLLSKLVSGDGNGSGGIGLSGLATLGGGLMDYFKQNQAANSMLDYLKQRQSMNDNMYAPGSPEYNALWDKMSAADAAAGRNSQYGTRSVDLAAKIAQLKMNANTQLTSNIAKNMSTAYNQRASAPAGLSSSLQNVLGSGNLNDILNLLGGNGGLVSTDPDTSWMYNPNATTASDASVAAAMQQYGIDPSLGWSD
jgi:hypothetical protein